jgi:hypothetical protein
LLMLPMVEYLMFHNESRFCLLPGNPEDCRYIYGIQSWFTSVQFTKPIFLRFVLILSFHECLGLQICVSMSFFSIKLCIFMLFICMYCYLYSCYTFCLPKSLFNHPETTAYTVDWNTLGWQWIWALKWGKS